MQALFPAQLLYSWASNTLTERLLGAGKLTVTVPGKLVFPWEFCTVYWKVNVVAVAFVGRDTVNPPWASQSTPAGGALDVTTVRGRLFGSELPNSRPGD